MILTLNLVFGRIKDAHNRFEEQQESNQRQDDNFDNINAVQRNPKVTNLEVARRCRNALELVHAQLCIALKKRAVNHIIVDTGHDDQ